MVATKNDLKKLSDAYSSIFENVSQPLPNTGSPQQQIGKYLAQHQQANPTKAVQPQLTTAQSDQPQPTTAQSDPQQQINSIMQRLGNLEKQVADLIAKQQQSIM